MREMQALVRNYVLNRDRQMKYLAVLIALSLFVSFMVPFILMQPADSMAEASACGIEEHVHTEEAGCYQLFCAPEEGEEHVHSERCYALICEKIVHTHTPNCYPTKPDFSALFSTIYDPENLKATADGKSYANSPNDKPSEYKAPAGSILGVATHFHIFAESVSLQSHVHGNIATNWLLQNGAFGVYNDRLNGMSSINYIRNLGPNGNLDNAYQTQLIMGSDYSSPPSPWFSNRYEIRSKKDRKTYYIPKDKFPMWFAPEYVVPQVKFEKKDRPFINITQELNKFAEMSMDLVEEAGAMNNDLGVSTKYPTVKSDPNGNFNGQSTTTPGTVVLQTQGENLTLDFSNIDDKYIYYTIDATNFDMVSPWSSWMKVLQIKGITEDKFLFLNIDVGTNPDAYFSKSWMVYKDDGTTYGTGEVPLEDGGCRVLYNIVSSDGNGGNYKPFEGKAVFGERRNGSILAPNADVNVAGNTNGTIIARNFVATGESHRCDIQQEGTEGDDADWSLGEDTPKPPQPKKIEITVQKEWSGQQLGQVKVYLYKSTTPNLDVATANLGTPHKEATLSSGNSWQTVFTDLPAEEAGKTLYYYVKEETLNNYTATYDKNGLSGNNGTVKITNVEQVQNITVSVEKKWDHPSGSSTSDITVILYKSSNPNLDATKPDQFTGNDATVAGTATLNSSNNWNATFNNLPAKENGNTLYYYIVEQNVPENYTVSYTGNGVNSANGKVTVTNAKGKMVSVTAKKQWKPSVPSNAIPVKVKLYQSKDSGLDATKPEQFSGMKEIDSATLSASNNWTYKFKEYPAANAKGEMYYYYIVESPVQSGYSAIYTNNGLSFNDGEIVVTNVKDITVTAKKIWDPDTVASTPTTQEPKTYKIMPIGDSITQGETGGGAANGGYRKYLDYIFDVKYEEYFGKDKTYDIDLVGPKNNIYPFSFEDAADEVTTTFPYNGVNVEHTYDNNHGGYSAMKIKDVYNSLKESDESGNLGSISKSQPDIILLMIGSNDKTAHRPVGDCETDLRELMDYIIAKGSSNSKIFLASIPEFTYAGGNVNENAEFNNMVKRVAQSYANSGKNVDFVDVHSWLNLDDLNDGIHPGEGGYEKMGKNWATVIDSYIQELQPVSSVPAETREPINVRLYKSQYGNLDATNADHVTQMQEVASATLNSDNGWTGKFEGLPAMENGSTLYYYVVEEGVPQYYTATYTNNAVNTNDGTVVVTNTKEKMLNITLDKEWVGGKPDNENITVTLYQSTERNLDMTVSDSEFDQLLTDGKLKVYRDEKDTGKSSVTFTAGETPHFTNLPVYNENGTMYYYYVRESDVSGYKPSYSKNPVYGADKVVTITNTKMISVSVTKNWQITTNLSTTPIEVVIYKYKHIPAEGEMSYWPTTYLPAAATPIKLADGETNWTQSINGNGTVTFSNLPVEEDGYKLFYYIVEKENAEVTKDFDIIYGPDTTGQLVDFNQPDTYNKTILNKEKAATEISITVNKDWDVEDFFYDFDKGGTMDPPNEYYVQDSVNPVEQWADPIKVTLQYSTNGTDWTDYERYKDVEFYTTYTFTNLPKTTGANNTGSPYYYRVVESYNYGYVTEYKYPGGKSNINASEIQKGQAMPEVELKNTLLKRTLNVKKNWYNNINDGVDKVVVEIYRRTTNKKPDLGINPDGTYVPETPGGTGGIIINSFDDGTAQGWTQDGAHERGDGSKSGLQTSVTYDESEYSYGLVSNGSYGSTADGKGYCAVIQKTFTTAEMVPGQTYTISAKATRNSTTPVYMALLVKNGDTLTEIARTPAIDESGVWETATCNYTVPANATGTTLVIAPVTGDGAMGTMMYVDDIRIEKVNEVLIFSEPCSDIGEWRPLSAKYGAVTVWSTGAVQIDGVNTLGVGGGNINGTDVEKRVLASDGAYRPLDSSQFRGGNSYKFKVDVHPRGNADEFVLGLRYTLNGQTYRADMVSAQSEANAWVTLESPAVKIPAGATNVQLCVYSKNKTENFNIANVSAYTASNGADLNAYNEPAAIVSTIQSWTFEDGTSGWTAVDSATINVATDFKHGGNQALTLGGTTGNGVKTTVSNLKPGTYRFSAYLARAVSWSDLSDVQIWAALNGGTEASIGKCTVTGSWTELTGAFTVTTNNTSVDLRIAWPGNENGTGLGQPIYIDDITITGPYPPSNSKPRNVETFFSGSNTLTKRQLNVQKIESVKLAKASAACQDYWYDTEIVYSENENVSPSIIEFDTFMNGRFVGDTVKHLEVQLYDQVAFPSEINIWLQGTGDFGGSNWKTSNNANGIVHTFAKNLTIKENTYLRVFTKKPQFVKRMTLTFTNGTTLTINNTTVLTDEAKIEDDDKGPDITGCNYSKDVALKNVLSDSSGSDETQDPTQESTEPAGEWVAAWDLWGEEISDTTNSINARWAGNKITSATVYFSMDYNVDEGALSRDKDAVNSKFGTAIVEKFGMYMLVNAYNNGAKDRNYNGAEVKVQSISLDKTSNTNYHVATYTFENPPTINSPNNSKNNLSTVILKTANNLKVKAVVLNCSNGEKWVINNTAYSHTRGITSDIRYHSFNSNQFTYDTGSNGQQNLATRWPGDLNERLHEIEVYFKKGVVKQETLTQQFKINNASYQTVTFDESNPVYDIARYTYYTVNNGEKQWSIWPSQLNTINGETTVATAIYQVVLTSNVGSKFVISNTAYAENNDCNTTADQFEKWYPFTQSDGIIDGTRINNVFLTIDDLGRDFYGKKIESLQMYINAKVTKDTTPGGMSTNTYLQDYESGNTEGKLTCVGNIGTSKETCQTVSGAYGLCNVFDYKIVDTYDGIADAAFKGANATDKWRGDRLNILTANPTDISRVVVTFDDGTTYTVWNMNYLGTEDGVLHYSHKTSFSANRDTKNEVSKDLLADSELIDRYEGRKLDYIVVTYGEDGDEFLSIPRDLLSYDGNTSNPSIGKISITHTFTNQIENPGVLKIIEDGGVENFDDDFTLADIKEVKLFYKDSDTNVDGENSTYTIYNTDYSPKAPADTPAIGNQPALGSDFVFISTLDLTKENGWQAALKGLPVTDGQGNAYEYVIVEKNVYGEGADRYQLVSYEHPDGVILEKDGTQTSFLNASKDDKNGAIVLPHTGGEGKTVFYFAGMALMLCGIAGCYGMKRRQRSRR